LISGKLIRIFGSSFVIQSIIQLLGILTGIYLVRTLAIDEYGYYTISNTIFSTMLILADGGLNSSLIRRGGQVYKNKEELRITLSTGLEIRKKFAKIVLIITIPILIFLLKYHGASNLFTFLITLSVVFSFLSTLTSSIYEIPFKLSKNIIFIQKNQLLVNLTRTLISFIMVTIFPFSFIGIAAIGFSRAIGNYFLKIKNKDLKLKDKKNEIVEKDLIKDIKKIMPTSIFYCISGQLTIYIITIFGDINSLASYGALTRVTAILAVFSSIFTVIMIPEFAKTQRKENVIKLFIKNQLAMFVISLILIFFVYVFDSEILFVLGSNYMSLNKELILVFIMGCLGFVGSISSALMNVKSIIMHPLYFITCSLFIQILFIFICDLKTLSGVIIYGIFTTLAIYLVRIFYFLFFIFYLKENHVK